MLLIYHFRLLHGWAWSMRRSIFLDAGCISIWIVSQQGSVLEHHTDDDFDQSRLCVGYFVLKCDVRVTFI